MKDLHSALYYTKDIYASILTETQIEIIEEIIENKEKIFLKNNKNHRGILVDAYGEELFSVSDSMFEEIIKVYFKYWIDDIFAFDGNPLNDLFDIDFLWNDKMV